MADCAALRPDLLAYLDGEATGPERDRIEAHLHTCQNCRDDLSRVAWEVGLFIRNLPAPAGAAGPSAGFTDRVMQAVGTTPRSDTPAAPVTPARRTPPVAPVRLLPPVTPIAPAFAWRTWAAAAAFVATAATVAFVFLTGEPTSPPGKLQTNPEGKGVVVARTGGVLRWADQASYDLGLAGSEWIAKDGSSPTQPGEYLHSPAPSSVHLRLPGGGQIESGPSCSLLLGDGGSVAVLDGAVTATAGPAGPAGPGTPLSLDAPGVHAESAGTLEMSVRMDGGAKASAKWFGDRAAAIHAAAPNANAPSPDAPNATILVYARAGAAMVATSSGPVRNSLERHSLKQGQAIVVAGSRVYFQAGVDDDAPPETASALGGLPIPPDSRFFAKPVPVASTGGGGALLASGPVRNSLERALSDPTTNPDARADALALFESVGGVEAVEAAAKAVDDPAVQVRSAAVRILALNSHADRPKALAALRRLAVDKDSGVAVFAIRALMVLEDRDAIPVFQTMVVDDDAPPEEVQVAAFAALVRMRDFSRVAEAASLLGRLNLESALGRDLQGSVGLAFQQLPLERIRQFLSDPRPGVRAAALLATQDLTAAKAALGSNSPIVQLAGVNVILQSAPDTDLDIFRPIVSGDRALRNGLIVRISQWARTHVISEFPAWVREAAQSILEDPDSLLEECSWAAYILSKSSPESLFDRLLSSGTTAQKTALISMETLEPPLVVRSLSSGDPNMGSHAIRLLASITVLPEAALPAAGVLDALKLYAPGSFEDARFEAIALVNLVRERRSEEAFQMLLRLATSTDARSRRASAYGLGALSARPEAASALEKLLYDADRATAVAAVEQVTLSSRRNRWAGRPVVELFPSASPHAGVRSQVAQVARRAGVAGAREAVIQELGGATPSTRASILQMAIEYDFLLDFQVPNLLRDPGAVVRLRLLLATTGSSRLEVARSLADDPAFWVQAMALAILAKEGDAAALEGLRVLIRDQKEGNADSDQLLGGLDPESTVLPDRVMMVSRMASDSGSVAHRLVDPASTASHAALSFLSRARRLSSTLARSSNPSERSSAASSLGDCPVLLSLEALALAADGDRETDPTVVGASHAAMEKLLGFVPKPSLKEWIQMHRCGYVSDVEIRARSGH